RKSVKLLVCISYFFLFTSTLFVFFIFFFFSSRRRHTRCLSDWSSDVCSSDLSFAHRRPRWRRRQIFSCRTRSAHALSRPPQRRRSEERRVGKECRSRWWR